MILGQNLVTTLTPGCMHLLPQQADTSPTK